MTTETSPSLDTIDQAVPLAPGDAVHALRRERAKVLTSTQGSCDSMFSPEVQGLSVAERLLVALHACRLSQADRLAAHYRQRALAEGADAALVQALEAGMATLPATLPVSARVRTILAFTATLITRPLEGDRAAIASLAAAGLSTPAIVALGQLIAFLSYQVRVVAGLRAMALPAPAAASAVPGGAQLGSPRRAQQAAYPVGGTFTIHGFTNAVLGWTPWLDTVDYASATPEQVAAVDEMSAVAKHSAYFLLLAHQPEILKQRSMAFNAIMFAPGGLPRAERELGATVESRVNGCVYCCSVHAQRFEQLAKRNDVIAQLFEAPETAGTTGREQAIVAFSILLGRDPGAVTPAHVQALRDAGLGELEVHDLVHAVALFAWANRLMLNLGEAVLPVPAEGATA